MLINCFQIMREDIGNKRSSTSWMYIMLLKSESKQKSEHVYHGMLPVTFRNTNYQIRHLRRVMAWLYL